MSVLTAFLYPLTFVFTYSVCPLFHSYLRAYDLNDFPLYKIQASRREEQKYINFVFRLLDKLVKEILLIFNIDTCKFINTPKLIDKTGYNDGVVFLSQYKIK